MGLFDAFRVRAKKPEVKEKKTVISQEFMKAVSEIDNLERELHAKEIAAIGIFRADNLNLPLFETYDDLAFYLYQRKNGGCS